MLFNIITIIVTSFICFLSFKTGYEVGKNGEIKPVPFPKFPRTKKDEAFERYNKIIENLENYDGTSNKQKRV